MECSVISSHPFITRIEKANKGVLLSHKYQWEEFKGSHQIMWSQKLQGLWLLLLLLLRRFSRVRLCATPETAAHQAPPSLEFSRQEHWSLGFHFLLQCMKVKSEREVAQSCPTPSDPMDCSLPGSSVHGIFPGKSTGVACHCLLRRSLESAEKNLEVTKCSQLKKTPSCLPRWLNASLMWGSDFIPHLSHWYVSSEWSKWVSLPNRFLLCLWDLFFM